MMVKAGDDLRQDRTKTRQDQFAMQHSRKCAHVFKNVCVTLVCGFIVNILGH